MNHSITWDQMTRAEVLQAIKEYDRLGPEAFFSKHGFAPTTTYDLVWDKRRYPAQGNLGLSSGDFEGGKTGAVAVLRKLGFDVEARRPAK
jgi:hypothetical protein